MRGILGWVTSTLLGVAWATLPVPAPAAGGPRDAFMPAPEDGPTLESMDRNEWMARLSGRFTFDGVIHHEEEILDFDKNRDAPITEESLPEWSLPVEGKADCIKFAEGPGLQCVLYLDWIEQWRLNGKVPMGGVSDITPGVVLAGFTPATAPDQVRFLLGDSRGIAHPGFLTIRGNSLVASPACVNLPGTMSCRQTFTITSRPDSRPAFVYLFTERRFHRNKLDRKRQLDMVNGRFERPMEYAEERLTVSFALRPDKDDPGPDQGSR